MRIPLLLTGLLAVLLTASPLPRASAQDDNAGGGDVSFDLFYNNLADDGDWYNTPEYGYVWQPFIAYKTDSWRPYSDGYWAQTDSGWTWVSYENFGWATYHYGRWTRLKDIGWAWVPGYQWGPGWVSWRNNEDYVGWAPLPPKVERGVYEGKIVERRPAEREVSVDYNDVESEDDGYTSNVDQDYDIGPTNYCFVETRSFGAPVLGAVLLPPERNVTIIEHTTNVTNIYYNRDRENVFVYNGGPRYDYLSAHCERPIQRLQIERVRNPSYLEEGLRAGGNPTQVRGGILQVAAPLIARRPVNFQQVKPVRVKQTLERPEVVHGWANTGANPEAVQQLHNRFREQAQQAPARAEAPKERVVEPLPPEQRIVTRQPAPAPAGQVGANGQPKDMTPEAVAARRAQRQQQRATQAGQPGQPAAQPGQPGQPKTGAPGQPLTDADRVARRNAAQQAREARTKQANGQPGQPAPGGQPGQPVPAGVNNGQPKDSSPEAVAARRAQRQQERAAQKGQPGAKVPEPAAQAAGKAPEQAAQPKDNSDAAKAARRAQRQQERAAQPQGQPQPQAQGAPKAPEQAGPTKDNSDEAKAARRAQRQQERAAQPQAQPQAQVAPQADAEREARRAQRQQERAAQPQAQPQPQANPQVDAEREARRAQRQQERAAQPQAQPQQQANPQGDQEREARRAQRQQERVQQPATQPQQANPQGDSEREARRAQRQQAQQQAQPAQQGNGQRGEHQGEKDKDKKDKPNQ